jgi:2-methylfumaryl-CoA hydratase
MPKANSGRFLEDFRAGEEIRHATPRTLTSGDAALYLALTGSRFAPNCSEPVARHLGLPAAPLDDLLVFHTVFGKTVPDISLNAIANLGYAECRWLAPVFAGDTLEASSLVLGVKENSSRQTGIVWVRTTGRKADGTAVLDYVRWVMVRKRDPQAPVQEQLPPAFQSVVGSEALVLPGPMHARELDPALTGSRWCFEDYKVGEKIDHVDGMGVMESEHRLATRLYQNTARVHFNDHAERAGRLGACIVYGGVVISLARALSFNGLGNAFKLLAINGGRHVNPCVAGDTVFAWSEVLDKASLPGRGDLGALRLRLVATKNRPCADFPLLDADGKPLPEVLLDLDLWTLITTRAAMQA